jgi:hypothetical protein
LPFCHPTPGKNDPYPVGTKVRVVPGTTADVHGRDMETFTGVVVKRIDQDNYSVRRTDLGPGFHGKKYHFTAMQRHTVDAETPTGNSRLQWPQLDERTKGK